MKTGPTDPNTTQTGYEKQDLFHCCNCIQSVGPCLCLFVCRRNGFCLKKVTFLGLRVKEIIGFGVYPHTLHVVNNVLTPHTVIRKITALTLLSTMKFHQNLHIQIVKKTIRTI